MTLAVSPSSVFPATAGLDIGMSPAVSECTVAQAAKFLDVSEGFVDEVLDDNLIKHRLEGGRRLIDWNSLQDYGQERNQKLVEAEGLFHFFQEIGLSDD